MKSVRQTMDIIAAYREVGSYRGAAAICNTTHRTVKRAVLKREEPDATSEKAAERKKNYDIVAGVVVTKVGKTSGRISAKRLLPEARVAGYSGSARNFRRLVARTKSDWRDEHHRGRRPAIWSPGETLVIDWARSSACTCSVRRGLEPLALRALF